MDQKENFFNHIRNGSLELVKELLETNPNLLESTDQRGSTPLLLASYYGHGEIVGHLLEKGAAVDVKDSTGNTALMGVCFKGYTKIAKMLIEAGANVNQTNSMGATCLIYAATFNRVEIAQMLLDYGADTTAKDARGNTALDHATMQGSQVLVDLLEKFQTNR